MPVPMAVDLAYEVPREGSNIWYDGWVIPKYAGSYGSNMGVGDFNIYAK